MNKKIFTPLAILIILLVIAAIIGVTLWIYSEKEKVLPQDETADWETYKNEEYGFEVKYPPNLIINFKNLGFISGSDYLGTRDFNFLIYDPKIEPSYGGPVSDLTGNPIWLYDGYNFAFFSGESAREHLSNYREHLSNYSEITKVGKNYSPPIQETTVRVLGNSYPFYYKPPSNLPNTDKTSYWFTSFPLENTSVIVTGNYDWTILNQILSTFKFLE